MGLNIRFKVYIYPQRYGSGFDTTLPLEVFTQKNFVAEFVRFKLIFIRKNDRSVFEPPFGGIRGNVQYTLHLHRVRKKIGQ